MRKAPSCEPSTRVVALAMGAALFVGCGGPTFHVLRISPPAVRLSPDARLWIATDRTDAFADDVATRLASALSDLASTRVVRPGASPEAGAVVLSLALHRSVSSRAELVQQPIWMCDPTGACWARQMPRMVDVPVVRVLARVGVHEAGRVLAPPRVLELEEAGQDLLTAELRLVGRVVRHVERLFRVRVEEVRLEVEALDGDAAREALERAVAAPSPERCEALSAHTRTAQSDAERARRLLATGRCWHAVGVASSDLASLRRAETVLLAAVRARPTEAYADALRRVREDIGELAPTAIPEPPPSYR